VELNTNNILNSLEWWRWICWYCNFDLNPWCNWKRIWNRN